MKGSGDRYQTGKSGELDTWTYLKRRGWSRPDGSDRKAVCALFKDNGIKIHPNGFDALKSRDLTRIRANATKKGATSSKWLPVLYEVKTCGRNRKNEVSPGFHRMGFTLTRTEKENAAKLKDGFVFILVNLKTEKHRLCKLDDFFHKSSARIYQTWSVFLSKDLPAPAR